MLPTSVCGVRTKRGRPCPIPVAAPGQPCPVHDPAGEYAAQHPRYRARLLAKDDRPDPAVTLRAWEGLRCGLCRRPVPLGDQVAVMVDHAERAVYGHVSCVLDVVTLEEVEPLSARP